MHLVLFDIDGTLVESCDFDTTCFQAAIKDVLGVSIDPDWSRYRHVTDSGILSEVVEGLGWRADGDFNMCYDKPLINRPAFLDSGDIAFVFPQAMQRKSDEIALGHQLICKRRLFGAVYREFLPKFFDNMPPDSGVMIGAFVPTDKVLPGVLFPGDIDLLIIPYASDRLLLSMTLAIELKVVRATYVRQGRSPNQYGFSQANALLRCGFPYAGVAHLIVSDESPEDVWRDVYETTIVDETGRCSPLRTVRKDMMPSALINRSFGRLRANCSSGELGYVSVYIANEGIWDPLGRQATHNPDASEEVMSAVGDFYELNAHQFLDTRRY